MLPRGGGVTSVSTAIAVALPAGARAILGRALESRELESFTRYLNLLGKWQRIHRLVGSVEPGWVVENLFLDSLLFLRVLPAGIASVADVGSGAGFPGIPIKIVRPDLAVTLIESRQRRVSFLTSVIRELGLTGARVLSGRVESIASEMPGAFDAVLMRCAGDSARLLPIVERLVVPEGLVILSGPPSPRSLTRGEWVEVPGVAPDSIRRFAVYRVPSRV
jgi:16S rRNA (guanine527-N7)-methyltransferase